MQMCGQVLLELPIEMQFNTTIAPLALLHPLHLPINRLSMLELVSEKPFADTGPVSRADRIPCANLSGGAADSIVKVTDLCTEWMPWELQ